ncbi:RAMP superfamily CRISPR-associated protein [Selenomonas sp. KH1T6]|uniref:RAMP superfamily CRISPR-associated protein n=1 Tax=Selenomonas sp. KH1T6 TaxID=3158784 RepID=UPI0008A75E77|nr:CRISPR-associated protein Csx10 [Selenomonas ruminantium]
MAGKDKKKASKKEQRELEKQRRIAMGQNAAKIKQQPKEAPRPVSKQSDTKEFPEAKINKIAYDYFTLRVHTQSPLHLGSGQADVNVDAEVIHDEAGLPYFPAKRLKGLLYESALEVTEMNTPLGNGAELREELDALFHHGSQGKARLIIPNLYLEGYEDMKEDWQYLQRAYPEIFTVNDVLEQYTSLRYQTRLDRKTGTAADGSLHNMRVVEAGLYFEGKIEVIGGTARHFKLLALAFKNLTQAGVKRTRGFGSIDCLMLQDGKDIRTPLIKDVFKEGKNR